MGVNVTAPKDAVNGKDRVVACAAISSDAPYAHPEAPTELREAPNTHLLHAALPVLKGSPG